MKTRTPAIRILVRTAVVALVAVSTAFFASCSKKDEGAAKKEEAAKELKAAKDAIKDKKFDDAAKSLQSASDKDDSEATLLLAFCYGEGKGVEKDEKKADELLKKAADAGNVRPNSCLSSRNSMKAKKSRTKRPRSSSKT